MKKFTLLFSLMVPLLTGTAAAQALNLTPFADNWKGELYQIDQQLKLPVKMTVYKHAL